MVIDYEAESKIFKALSEPTRLRILDILSYCEMCACNMLDSLSITQSTLSHHMKVLMDCGLVLGRKSATWMYYSICPERMEMLHQFLEFLTHPKDECICKPHQTNC